MVDLTQPTRPRSAAGAAGVALALAGVGAASLGVGNAIGFLTPSTEALFTLLFIAGLVLLTWSAIIITAVAFLLLRAVARRQRPALVDTALVLATAAVIAGVAHASPLVGSSGGSG